MVNQMTNVVKMVLNNRSLLALIKGLHQIQGPSARKHFLVCVPSFHERNFRKLSYDARVHRVDAQLATSQEKENHSMPEMKNVTKILDQFERICESDDFTSIMFHPITQDCVRLLPCLGKDNYVRLVGILLGLKEKFGDLYDCDDNFIRMSKHLNDVLRKWLSQSEPDQVLNALRMSGALAGRHVFMIDVMKKLKRVLKWPTAPMLQYVRHINENHLWNIYHVEKYWVEYALLRRSPYLNIDQTAILLQAMNELRADVSSPDLPRRVFQMFLDQHASADQSTISVFVKFFSRMVPCFWVQTFNVHSLLPDLMSVMNQHADSWPLETIVDFASFCRRIVCYDEVFFKTLARRMVSDEALRLKSSIIDELVMAVVYFNGAAQHTDELARFAQFLAEEPLYSCLMTHPKRLVSIVNNLSKVGIYDDYFLEVIFSNGFLRETYKKLNHHYVSVNVYSLDQNVQVEHCEYSGRRLDEKLRQLFQASWNVKVSKFLLSEPWDDWRSRHASAHEHLVHEMRPILQELLGEECVHLCYLHPHIPRTNFVFALKDGVPQKLSEKLKASHRLLPAELKKEFDWYTFKFLTPNSLPPHEPLLLYNGITSARLQTLMGINSIPFVGKNWKSMAEGEQIAHLRELIFAKS